MKLTGTLGLLATLVLACSSNEGEPADGVAPVGNDRVFLLPADLSTSIGDGALLLRVVTSESSVQTRLDRAMPRVTLRAFPSREVIPFTHSVLPPVETDSILGQSYDPWTDVRLTPSRDISQGWYVLEYDASGDDTQVGLVENPVRGQRRAEVRFSLESRPTVSNVWLADKGDGKQSLRVSFSEPVRHDAQLLTGIQLALPAGSTCVAQGDSPAVTSVRVVTFVCSGERVDHLGLALSSAVVSAASGRPVTLPRSAAERQASGEVLSAAGSHVDIDFATQGVRTDGGLTSVWIPD